MNAVAAGAESSATGRRSGRPPTAPPAPQPSRPSNLDIRHDAFHEPIEQRHGDPRGSGSTPCPWRSTGRAPGRATSPFSPERRRRRPTDGDPAPARPSPAGSASRRASAAGRTAPERSSRRARRPPGRRRVRRRRGRWATPRRRPRRASPASPTPEGSTDSRGSVTTRRSASGVTLTPSARAGFSMALRAASSSSGPISGKSNSRSAYDFARPARPRSCGRPAPTRVTGDRRCAARCSAVTSAASSSSATYCSSSTNRTSPVEAAFAAVPTASSRAVRSC